VGAQIAVFFDIGDTVASAVVAAGHLDRLEVYPFVPEVLRRLRAGAAIGLISNTGHESAKRLSAVLAGSGLSDLVDQKLCLFSSVEGLDKSQPLLFTRAADRAGLDAARCVYVGEDGAERAVAASAGFHVSPHPLHALHLVESGLPA
jgi:FMN phosphatase YigB (HAD superfamily)